MGCGKSKHAVATVENTAVLGRKKSSSGSTSFRDVERNHNVTAGTNEINPTNNDSGNKASEVKEKENENGGNSSTVLSQNKSDGGPKDLKDGKSNGNDGAGKNDSFNASNNGDVASGVKQKENSNGSSDVHASGDGVKSDIEAKTEVVQEESREGKEPNKSEEVIGLDNGDKNKQEVPVITHEKTESEGKSDEKFESDTPSHEAPKQDPVAENVEADDATVEEEKNGGEQEEEMTNEDAGMKKEIEKQTPETDVTASTPEEKAEDKPQPEDDDSN